MHLIHRLMRIEMILEHVLYITYALPAAVLRPVVPAILPLATASDDQAFLSVVLLRCRKVNAAIFPLLQFNYRQINIRTYVRDPATGAQGVYFLHSAVTSPLIAAMTQAIGIPWKRGVLELTISPAGEKGGFGYHATGHHRGEIVVRADERGPLPAEMPLFGNSQDAIEFLILPLSGFFGGTSRVKGFFIEHPALDPQTLRLREIKLPLLTDMALLKQKDLLHPHSVFYVPEASFRIYLPAKNVR